MCRPGEVNSFNETRIDAVYRMLSNFSRVQKRQASHSCVRMCETRNASRKRTEYLLEIKTPLKIVFTFCRARPRVNIVNYNRIAPTSRFTYTLRVRSSRIRPLPLLPYNRNRVRSRYSRKLLCTPVRPVYE